MRRWCYWPVGSADGRPSVGCCECDTVSGLPGWCFLMAMAGLGLRMLVALVLDDWCMVSDALVGVWLRIFGLEVVALPPDCSKKKKGLCLWNEEYLD
jgi:hypothetical protein